MSFFVVVPVDPPPSDTVPHRFSYFIMDWPLPAWALAAGLHEQQGVLRCVLSPCALIFLSPYACSAELSERSW